MTDLSVDIAGIKMRTPVMIASGFVFKPDTLLRIAGYEGVGAIVPKTIRRYETDGNESPVFDTFGNGSGINAVGLSCPGVDEYIPWYNEYRDRIEATGTSIIGSIKPEKISDFVYVLRKLAPVVRGLELNGSCPNVPGGTLLCESPELTAEYVSVIKNEFPDKPLLFKASPNVDVVAPVQAAKEAGADAAVLINTVTGKEIDPDTGWSVTTYGTGGVSGPAVLPIGLRCVSRLYEADIGLPIVGCGGISGWEDMVKYFRAGADAVQWGTCLFLDTPIEFGYGGTSVKKKLYETKQNLEEYIKSFGSFAEFLTRCRNE